MRLHYLRGELSAVAELPLGGVVVRRFLDVLEGGDHDVAEKRHDFDEFEDAIHARQRYPLLVVHLVDVTLFPVHQVKTESDHLRRKLTNK